MNKKKAISLIFLVLASGTLPLLPAQASHITITHDDVEGPTVDFTSIVESSETHDPLPLYGQPEIIDPPFWIDFENWLDFPITHSFSAWSSGGSGANWTNGTLTLMIEAKPGHAIERIFVGEIGQKELRSGADAKVWGDVTVEIPDGPAFDEDLHFSSFHSSLWFGTADFEFEPCCVTKVNVTVDNWLVAKAIWHHTFASIKKTHFFIKVDTEPCPEKIPEPATGLLLVAIASVLRCMRGTRRG